MKICKKDIMIFIIIFIFSLLIFHNFLTMHYAPDTYELMEVGYKEYAIRWFLADGRIFSCIVLLIANIINLPINVYIIGSLIVAIFISCISVIVLKNTILEYKEGNKPNMVLVLLMSYVTIFNFTYLELLFYGEACLMVSTILIYILAAKRIVNNPDKKHILQAAFIAVLSMFLYQGTAGFFFAITFLFSILKNKKNYDQTIMNILVSIMILSLGTILNVLLIFIAETSSINNNYIVIETDILRMLYYFKAIIGSILLNSLNMFPKYMILSIVMIVLVISTGYFMINKKDNKNSILSLLLVLLVFIVSSFARGIISLTSLDAPRMHFCVGAIIGVVYIFLYCNTEIFKSKIKYLMTIILVCYFLTTVTSYLQIMYEHKVIIYRREQEKGKEIKEYISTYEESNNIQVTNIKIIRTSRITNRVSDEEIKWNNSLTLNAFECRWSVNGAIEFHTGKKLINEQKAGYSLESVDIDVTKQYQCIDNTFYINTYF